MADKTIDTLKKSQEELENEITSLEFQHVKTYLEARIRRLKQKLANPEKYFTDLITDIKKKSYIPYVRGCYSSGGTRTWDQISDERKAEWLDLKLAEDESELAELTNRLMRLTTSVI